ncbi:hypothetical protein K1T71_006850 [Dendrolimus kikuchii]|uniref:Uncharacterized protein n=1 Tax=Dendrolimus kikuchii TaxID=765133 RepID=A0ACC1D2B2_9NEOP|nr:hypothetical protein K1T71_006850 [Dendrolimus kikuchii]
MVVMSTQRFAEVFSDVHCSSILHPWDKGCISSSPLLYKEAFVGSAKFYAIIYLIQILMRGKNMRRKKEWVKMGQYYIRSTLLGQLITASAPNISCTLRKLMGNKFNYYTYLFIPFTLNGLFIYLEPPSRRGLVINLFVNLYIEYWLRVLQRANYINITKSKQTILFMAGSAALFYLMRLEGDKKERTPLFWLFTPEKVRRKTEESKNVCPHDGPCQNHIAKGYATYFGVGLAITLARVILPKISSPMRAISSIRGKHFKLALFFGSYIGIYRAVICYLCRKRGFDSALYALPAGYLAGLSYLFSPSLGMAIGSVTAAMKLYSTILYEKKLIPTSVPLPELLYCICQGTLFHARIMQPDVCPSYVFNVMTGCSNGRSEMIAKNFFEILEKANG